MSSIKQRLHKINQVKSSSIYTNKTGYRAYALNSVRTGKPYQVILQWSKVDSIPTAKTFLFTFDFQEATDLYGTHPANNNPKTIDYMTLGTIKSAASQQDKQVSFCDSQANAERLSSIGGQIIKIVNRAGAEVWAVVEERKSRLQRNVQLMRGPVEMGIE